MLTLVALLFCAILSAQTAPQPQPTPGAFDDQAASRLLLQLSEALQGHSQKQFLALFDLDRMKDGAVFKQQINSFFAQTDSIRVHLNLGEISVDGDKAMLAVEAEMEAQPSNGGPPSRRNERLNFTVAQAGNAWKIIDVQPRSFFSLP
ncbi:MAG TPA: hypothetical protein VGP65_02205 [Candidatus Angelobacter sp.]|jgi:hypothetical protein|nr:hypothetical protein [Candidatus Angelobacter sp.]